MLCLFFILVILKKSPFEKVYIPALIKMGSIGPTIAQAVTVSFQELLDGEDHLPRDACIRLIKATCIDSVSFETLTDAFGPSSLGIIVVKDLVPKFKQLRSEVLSNASYLAALPEQELGMHPFHNRPKSS